MFLLINPSFFGRDYAPIIGIPQLLGILKSQKIKFEYLDLNLKYNNYLLTDEGISELIDIFHYTYSKALNNEIPFRFLDKNYKRGISALKYIKIRKEFISYILKNKKTFFKILLYLYCSKTFLFLEFRIFNIVMKILNNIMPDIYNYRTFSEPENFKLDIEKLIEYFESDFCQFRNLYEKEVDIIIQKNPKIIGISINLPVQLITGLYLCYLIKKKSDIYINIGGCFFNYFYKIIDNLSDLFKFFDSISINDNTCTNSELVKFINKEISIEEVGNIIYKENGKLKINYSERRIPFRDLPFQDFDSVDKNNYLLSNNKLTLPIQTSTSCYWKRCIFCTCAGSKYETKSVEAVIKEIEYQSKRYNTKYFYFWDNALHPKYLEKLADLLIEKKLNIKYSIFARFEEDFDLKLLEKVYKSGCLNINWGLDSASDKILKIIDKGIKLNNVEKILKYSHKAGIYNTVYLILGHPEETVDDLDKNLEFVQKNKKYINKLIISPDVLFINGSPIYKERDKYKAKIITTPRERYIYMKKLNKIIPDDPLFGSVTIVQYMAKKGLKGIEKDKKLLNFMQKHKILYGLYINFYLFKFNIDKRLNKLLPVKK